MYAYMDDLTICCPDAGDVNRCVNTVVAKFADIGLKINIGKSKVLSNTLAQFDIPKSYRADVHIWPGNGNAY